MGGCCSSPIFHCLDAYVRMIISRHHQPNQSGHPAVGHLGRTDRLFVPPMFFTVPATPASFIACAALDISF